MALKARSALTRKERLRGSRSYQPQKTANNGSDLQGKPRSVMVPEKDSSNAAQRRVKSAISPGNSPISIGQPPAPLSPRGQRTSKSAQTAMVSKSTQLKLFGKDMKQEMPFGGSLLKNSHAKTKRPFAPRAAMHVTLKTRGYGRLLKAGRRKRIEQIVQAMAVRHLIRVHSFSNAGNHLHFLLMAPTKDSLSHFLRALSGSIALMVQREELSEKNPTETSQRFWMQRPWSRILSRRGNAFLNAVQYIQLNEIESWGVSRHHARMIVSTLHDPQVIRRTSRLKSAPLRRESS